MNSLSRNTDALTEALRDAEDALDALALGVTVTVPLGPDPAMRLAWTKSGPDWGLMVIRGNGDHVPLTSASRRERVLAADALFDLRKAMGDEAAKTDLEVVVALQRTRAFVEATRAELPSSGDSNNRAGTP